MACHNLRQVHFLRDSESMRETIHHLKSGSCTSRAIWRAGHLCMFRRGLCISSRPPDVDTVFYSFFHLAFRYKILAVDATTSPATAGGGVIFASFLAVAFAIIQCDR